mmetsp:Transcript_124726/g.249063  ORF Transcript_124726/g.249063 Transcript_124726/m.249063 type:complete len:495 (-) Transcript_124726:197-1681(-)
MELGHRVWLRTTFGSCRTCRDPNAAHALPRPPQGLSLATRVLNQDGHTIARASRAVTDSGHWRTWGVAIPALGISRHLIPRGLARPAVATQEDPGKRQQLGFWPALLAYVILTQVHQRSLRGLVASGLAPPSLAVVIGLHTLAFLIAALFVGLGQRGSAARRTLVVPLAVLITEVFSWEALGRLRGNDHLALSVALLSGLMLPLCMAASRPFLGRRFSFGAWVGAFMVAAGVGLCHLGHPLMSVGSTAEAVLLGAACFLPCLSLVGKEALLTGNQRFSIPAVGLLICIAQLLAVVLPRYRPPTSAALYTELATLWHSRSLAYVFVSGLLRVSLLVLIRASSASMLQLANAMAVPVGAAIVTSGLQQNVEALLLASGGAALYLLGREREQVPKFVEPALAKKAGKRMSFLDELKQEKKEAERMKGTEAETSRQAKERAWMNQQEANRRRLDAQQRQKKQSERLRRLQARWSQQEERQREGKGQQQPPEPLMYADE